MFTKKNV